MGFFLWRPWKSEAHFRCGTVQRYFQTSIAGLRLETSAVRPGCLWCGLTLLWIVWRELAESPALWREVEKTFISAFVFLHWLHKDRTCGGGAQRNTWPLNPQFFEWKTLVSCRRQYSGCLKILIDKQTNKTRCELSVHIKISLLLLSGVSQLIFWPISVGGLSLSWNRM